MHIRRSIHEPIREGQSWEERWAASDSGLIACWERGREQALEDPEMRALAKAGQLMPLGWKGGVDKDLKSKRKFGTLKYLAKWQGIRGDDLNIDTELEVEHTCTKTGVTVTFTSQSSKWAEP
jgi:hypothetical protein